MMVKRRLLVLAFVVSLALLLAPAVIAGPAVGKATGGGTYISNLGNHLEFSLSAQGLHVDAHGQVHAYIRNTDGVDVGFRGVVDCLVVFETRANLSGIVKSSDDPDMVGQHFFIQAWDLDQDVISEAVVPGPGCAGHVSPMTTYPLRSGNIRIPFSDTPPTT